MCLLIILLCLFEELFKSVQFEIILFEYLEYLFHITINDPLLSSTKWNVIPVSAGELEELHWVSKLLDFEVVLMDIVTNP